jgi:AraC-like DNA-binding protein
MIEKNRGLIVKRKDGSEVVNYDDENFPSYIYNGYIYIGCTWERIPHYHEDVELLSVYSGEMEYMVDGINIHLKKGDTIFVNSGRIHYSIATDPRVSQYIIAVMHPKIICSSEAVEKTAVNPIITDKTVPFVHFNAADFDAPLIRQFMVEMERDAKKNPFQITKYFFEIWDIIMHRFTDAYRVHIRSMEEIDDHNAKLKSMMFFIDEHYKERITLKKIADAGGVSQTLCNQIFNKFTEKSPIEYLMQFRCRKVADLLQTGTMPMTEIADVTGFSGASYMAETFKKYFNMTPSEFKKKFRRA